MPTEIKYTVYILLDPRNNEIKYVGITQRPLGMRLTQHLNEINNPEKLEWIEELRLEGIKPIIQAIEENLTRQKANERETYWIKHYLSVGVLLTNISKVRVYNRSEDILQLKNSKAFLPHDANNEEYSSQKQLQIDESQQHFSANSERKYIPMKDAAKILGVSYYKIRQLVLSGDINAKYHILDKRAIFVDIEQAKKLFDID